MALFAARSRHRVSNPTSHFDLVPEDDSGVHRRRRRRKVFRRFLFLVALICVGWAQYNDPSLLPRIWSQIANVASPLIQQPFQSQGEPSGRLLSASTGNASLFNKEASSNPATPFLQSDTDAAPLQKEPSGASEATSTPETPKVIAALPPVHTVKPSKAPASGRPSKTNSLSQRARAAGLHPDLSPVLLSKLTSSDFRNARYAIRTALTKTSDKETFVWPPRFKAAAKRVAKKISKPTVKTEAKSPRKPARASASAVFEVSFVPGAAKGCRRYVVTIEKDRWLTTALPLEKCAIRTKKD